MSNLRVVAAFGGSMPDGGSRRDGGSMWDGGSVRHDGAHGLAEPDARPAVAAAPSGQGDGVAVLEVAADPPIAEVHGLRSAPRALDQAPAFVVPWPADGARGVQVAGTGRRSVRGEVRELLGEGPVGRREVDLGDDDAFQF